MPTSNIKIKKICEWCGKEFEAFKGSTRFCSHECACRAYKKKKRQEQKREIEALTLSKINIQQQDKLQSKELFSVKECAELLGLSRDGVYKLIYRGSLKAYHVSKRMTFIMRTDISSMILDHPYEPKTPNLEKDQNSISEFYTTQEIIQKFGVSHSWVFAQGKAHNIPKVHRLGKTYWSKIHCDRIFGVKSETPKEDDWVSYSEVREKYNLSHDQIQKYVKRHGLQRKKIGKYTYVLRKEIDSLLSNPSI